MVCEIINNYPRQLSRVLFTNSHGYSVFLKEKLNLLFIEKISCLSMQELEELAVA